MAKQLIDMVFLKSTAKANSKEAGNFDDRNWLAIK
jgi:hypothetical protein